MKLNLSQNRSHEIKKAGQFIADGKLVAFPTETVYGLGANALDSKAVQKIFKAKGRPSDNPLIVHIANMKELDMVAQNVPEIAQKLMRKFWPGPLTFVLPKKKIVPDVVTAGGSTVAVRMPKHPIALAIIRAAKCPVAAPSANLAGKPSPTTATHVMDDFGDSIDFIIDGGKTRHGLESTVIDVTRSRVEILRTGSITQEMLSKVLGYIPKVVKKTKGKVRSPGLKYRHYAPSVPMLLIGSPQTKIMVQKLQKKLHSLSKKLRVGVLCVKEHANTYQEASKVVVCGSLKKPESFGSKLYASLRAFNKKDVDIILAENIGKGGVALASFDRLSRAADKIL